MSGLKLGRLPDRTPVRISFHASPDLARSLQAYADYLNGQHVSGTGNDAERRRLPGLRLSRTAAPAPTHVSPGGGGAA